jgi:peptidoglycan/xylan/chitin deacetylase (PgdA/CDA1 family)
MKLPKDRVPYSAIVDRPALKLPGGARVAVWTIVNVEEWSIERPMPRTVLPPPFGQPLLPDLPNWAWHEYGMRVGFWRFVEVLRKFQIRATLALNGSVCRSYPRVAKAALEAGWEFMGHGYVQRPMHQVEDQRAAIRQTIDEIKSFTGKPPRGWESPGLTETYDTIDWLAEAGVEYVADWCADEQPFPMKVKDGTLYSIPYSNELNDIPLVLTLHRTGEQMYEAIRDQFDVLYQEGQDNARVMAIALHPMITGQPHRAKYLDQALGYISGHRHVWLATGSEILDAYLAQTGGAR